MWPTLFALSPVIREILNWFWNLKAPPAGYDQTFPMAKKSSKAEDEKNEVNTNVEQKSDA